MCNAKKKKIKQRRKKEKKRKNVTKLEVAKLFSFFLCVDWGMTKGFYYQIAQKWPLAVLNFRVVGEREGGGYLERRLKTK